VSRSNTVKFEDSAEQELALSRGGVAEILRASVRCWQTFSRST
jgi:hypothetical protein